VRGRRVPRSEGSEVGGRKRGIKARSGVGGHEDFPIAESLTKIKAVLIQRLRPYATWIAYGKFD